MYSSIADSKGNTYHQLVTISHRDFWDRNSTGQGVHKQVESVLPRRRQSHHGETISSQDQERIPPLPHHRSAGHLRTITHDFERSAKGPTRNLAGGPFGTRDLRQAGFEEGEAGKIIPDTKDTVLQGRDPTDETLPPNHTNGHSSIPYRDTHGFTLAEPLPTLNPTPSIPHRKSSERSRSRVRFSNIPDSDPAPAIPQQDISALDQRLPSITSKKQSAASQPDVPRQIQLEPTSADFNPSNTPYLDSSRQFQGQPKEELDKSQSLAQSGRPASLSPDLSFVDQKRQLVTTGDLNTQGPTRVDRANIESDREANRKTVPVSHSPADLGRVNRNSFPLTSNTGDRNLIDREAHNTSSAQNLSQYASSTPPRRQVGTFDNSDQHPAFRSEPFSISTSSAKRRSVNNTVPPVWNTSSGQPVALHQSQSTAFASPHNPQQIKFRQVPTSAPNSRSVTSPVRPEPTVISRSPAPQVRQPNSQVQANTTSDITRSPVQRKPVAAAFYTTTTHSGPTVITPSDTSDNMVFGRNKQASPGSKVVTTTTTTTTTIPPGGVARTSPKPSLIDRIKGNDESKTTTRVVPAPASKRNSLLSRKNHVDRNPIVTSPPTPQRTQGNSSWMNKIKGMSKKDGAIGAGTVNNQARKRYY